MSASLAIGLSVLMHVGWNLMARHIESRCRFLWWGLLGHILMLGPWALWALIEQARWTWGLALLMVISAISNALYFLMLQRAYQHAPVALVYPVARSSPLLIALWGVLLFGEVVPVLAWLGILIVVAGLMMLAYSGRNHHSGQALPWALAAALCTSVYSLSDKAAVEALPGFAAQMGFITVGYILSFLTLSYRQIRSDGSLVPTCRPRIWQLVTGGLFIGSAYTLVIHAMQTLPASYVVAYTNSGIIIASLLSILVFRERHAWRLRLIATVIVTVGLAVLSQASTD